VRASALALFAAALSAAAVSAASAAPPAADGSALVRAAIAAPRHVSYVGQVSTIRSGGSRAYAVVAQIEHRAPDETRRTYLAPQSLYGQYVITHGRTSWDVQPSRKRIVVSDNDTDPGITREDSTLLEANYRAVRAGGETIADRRADIIDFVNRYTGQRALRMWTDSATHVVLAKEAYHGDGSLAWRLRYDEIRFTGSIPAAVFSADLPHDFTSVHGREYGHPSEDLTRAIAECGFSPIGPKDLPDGFNVSTADLSTVKGVKNLHLTYSDGLRTVSLFENATDRAIDFGALTPVPIAFDGHNGQYVRDGQTTLLAWRERGLAFALVGDLDLKELVKIATSVVP